MRAHDHAYSICVNRRLLVEEDRGHSHRSDHAHVAGCRDTECAAGLRVEPSHTAKPGVAGNPSGRWCGKTAWERDDRGDPSRDQIQRGDDEERCGAARPTAQRYQIGSDETADRGAPQHQCDVPWPISRLCCQIGCCESQGESAYGATSDTDHPEDEKRHGPTRDSHRRDHTSCGRDSIGQHQGTLASPTSRDYRNRDAERRCAGDAGCLRSAGSGCRMRESGRCESTCRDCHSRGSRPEYLRHNQRVQGPAARDGVTHFSRNRTVLRRRERIRQ